MAGPSSLLSQRSSDSGLYVHLHPLVLLTVSDHITRHAARSQPGPTIGALLGQQSGRQITLEHAFECNLITGPHDELLLPEPWFEERLKQFKDVHKAPVLDLVGWWSTAPPSGPGASHLPIHKHILQEYNESAVFLAFHPSQLHKVLGDRGKLPITVYESVYEGGDNATDEGKAMQLDGQEQLLSIRFRELPYSIETGEAEMICIESVARGGNATTIGSTKTASTAAADVAGLSASEKPSDPEKERGLGGWTEDKKDSKRAEVPNLNPEEEDLISSLNTRLNAIKALESRISLVKSYLSSLSISEATIGPQQPPLSHPILRNINSLISNLSLLSPSQQSDFSAETIAQSNDVILVSVLSQLGRTVKAMRELGRKAAVVQNAKRNQTSRKSQVAAMQSRLEEDSFPSVHDRNPSAFGRLVSRK